MKIIVIAGFLGSGKTSTLRNLITPLGGNNQTKLAVIINDFGEIGIDTSVVGTSGIDPVELVSGCVCCQLGVDLLKTIEEVYVSYQPTTIILEPSGVANPISIKSVLTKLKDIPVERILNLVLIDPTRFDLVVDIPVIQSGIIAADLLVITKTDLVDNSQLKMLRHRLRGFNKMAEIIEISNQDPETLQPIMEVIKNA
jgi:G3E family GTPase